MGTMALRKRYTTTALNCDGIRRSRTLLYIGIGVDSRERGNTGCRSVDVRGDPAQPRPNQKTPASAGASGVTPGKQTNGLRLRGHPRA